MQVVKKTVYELRLTRREFLDGLNAYAKRIGSDLVLTEDFIFENHTWEYWEKGFPISDYVLSIEWLPDDQEFNSETYKEHIENDYDFLCLLASALPIWNIPNLKEILDSNPEEVILFVEE